MGTKLFLIRSFSLLSVSMIFPLLFAGAIRGQTTKTEIDYTGSLMGYYRMEYGEAGQAHLPPVESLLKFRQGDSSRLLLAMGDNFGPEFGASLQLENDNPAGRAAGCYQPQNKTGTGETRPESLYKDDDRVAAKAECDNVLDFLMHAGFRALVPGSQDFMYTARWLRVSALLLSNANQDPEQIAQIGNFDRKVHLLGANLRIAMSGRAGGSQARCPLLFSQDPFAANAFRCVGDGKQPEPLDWLTRLDRVSRDKGDNPTVAAMQQLAAESAAQAKNGQSERESLVSDEISIMQSAWGPRFHVPPLPPPENAKHAQAGGQVLSSSQAKALAAALDKISDCPAPSKTGDQADMCVYASSLSAILKSFSALSGSAGNNPGAGAATQAPAANKVNGAAFTLTEDARDAAINGLLRTIANEENDIGYTVARTADGSKVLIVGVVGENTMNAVSQTNLRLCKGKGGSSTDAFGPCGTRVRPGSYGGGAAVLATDPVPITEAIVRGAELTEGPFDKVIVMAQMSHTEAEVLAARVGRRLTLAGAQHPVDVVLSEADSGYGTPQLALNFPPSPKATHSAPVVTPIPSYSSQDGSYPGQVSRLTLDSGADGAFTMTNQTNGIFTPPPVSGSLTTISLLYRLVAQLQHAAPPASTLGTDLTSKQKAEFALLNDLQKASRPRADMVLLQSRDVELDAIGPDYSGYAMCAGETAGDKYELCELRVALDRIFWKGDYLEYVAVTGKALQQIIALSESKMAEQAELADTGFTKQWLISYGIVQSTLTNLTEINENNEPLWIPVDPSCTGVSTEQSVYCIGGTPVNDDSYYWLLTSDQLAQDKAVYGTLQSLPPSNHEQTDLFITAPLSHYLLASVNASSTQAAALPPLATGSAERIITTDNEKFQQLPLWQVDFAKMITSFTSRQPIGGNKFVGGYFQGVSDARASAPASQDLDLELASRVNGSFFGPNGITRALAPVSLGVQSSFAYDRAVIGNLSPATKPINASYSLNNLTEGAFVQIRLDAGKGAGSVRSVRSLPRDLLVLTPHQYQIEINNPYLFFPFASSSAVPGELTVQLPRISGWTDRAGFRREFGRNRPNSLFWSGSYVETGMEFNIQSGVLSALTLETGSKQKTCQVNATITLQTCFSQSPALVINSTTTLVGSPAVKTLHAPGYYWDIHFQNHLFGGRQGKQLNLVTDTQGDYYFGRPSTAELPTQTEYAIPLSVSLVFPSFGNLSFAPTYSAFFYKSQLSAQSLQVNSFSIAARWYFARDARVPVRRQAPLAGPATADQTKTGKGH